MKAILKCKHQLFCSFAKNYKQKKELQDKLLEEMLEDLANCFASYIKNKDELILASALYESKQRKIKQRLKELGKRTI